jgi:polygalacturonase
MNSQPKWKVLARYTFGFVLLAAMVASGQPNPTNGVWNARNHGARGDGRTLDTQAIQAAVDACAHAGGGTVLLHSGVFMSGTIRLRSHVTLSIAEGTVLRGSAQIQDYPAITPKAIYLYRDRFKKSLIYAEGEEHIALTGRGTVDGQGSLFPAKRGDDDARPYLIRFSECRDVQVRDLTFRDSARWLSHYLGCENVEISGVTIRSRIRENRDGMDIDSCDRVHISNCDIYSGDDAIVLKSTMNRPCRRVTVSNCTLSSGASALKLGTESQGGFEDITFDNCVIYDTPGTAICLGEVDGGVCERINVSNITIKGAEVAIFVRLGNRATPIPGLPPPGMGKMRDILISNIQASGIKNLGCSITGIPQYPVENVTLQNIRIRFAGGGTAADAARAVPEKETGYPNGKMFGILPAYGFYCRHVNGLRLHNLDLAWENVDARPALLADDVADLGIFDLRAQLSASAESLIRLVNVQGALVQGTRLPEGTNALVRISGAQTKRIKLTGNDVPTAQQTVASAMEVPADAVQTETGR